MVAKLTFDQQRLLDKLYMSTVMDRRENNRGLFAKVMLEQITNQFYKELAPMLQKMKRDRLVDHKLVNGIKVWFVLPKGIKQVSPEIEAGESNGSSYVNQA